jgi:uncharacterized protein YaeQ
LYQDQGMALTSTLYRFRIQLSDVDRDCYRDLEVRLARHPSESVPFLLMRVIAYALNLQDGIEFSRGGISSTDEPALAIKDLTGAITEWIEVGNPSARRLHRATKVASRVRIYTPRDPVILQQELAGEEIHRKDTIEIFSLPAAFLDRLGQTVGRENRWVLLRTEGELSITCGDVTVQGELVGTTLR